MDNLFFERPILNSPYKYPARYWKLDEHGQPLNVLSKAAAVHVKKTGNITNSEYQRILGVAKRTAHRDLSVLVEKGSS